MLPHLEEGKVYLCGCGCGHPFIMHGESLWMLEGGERWYAYSLDTGTFDPVTEHPNADRIFAAFVAAQLRGEIAP